jgi:hypothetical protein
MMNPQAKPWLVLGVSQANWDAAVAALTTYLQNHADQQYIPDATIRALHPALADDHVWAEMKKALGG